MCFFKGSCCAAGSWRASGSRRHTMSRQAAGNGRLAMYCRRQRRTSVGPANDAPVIQATASMRGCRPVDCEMHLRGCAHGPQRYARPMTEELFREDAALDACDARITALGEAGIERCSIRKGGSQAGDRGELRTADGRVLAIANTKKGGTAGAIVHLPAPGQEALLATLPVGMSVQAAIDRARRRRHMRFHTAMHLLCAPPPSRPGSRRCPHARGPSRSHSPHCR